MAIRKRRIQSVEKYFGHLKEGQKVRLAILDPENFKSNIKKIGLSYPLISGEKILPTGTFGRISNFNANGKYLIMKNKAKETVYHQREWTREEWAGYRQTRTVTDTVDIPYERYPRKFAPPPSVEFTVIQKDGDYIICTDEIEKNKANEKYLKHNANLFLEIFGEFTIIDTKLSAVSLPKIKRLNWEILPKGELPWGQAKKYTDRLLERTKNTKRPVIEKRLKFMSSFGSDFMAIGRGGFRGYIVYGFPRKNKFVLESAYHGNATYVFNQGWKELSQMTKAEILNENLHDYRVIHSKTWENNISKILN